MECRALCMLCKSSSPELHLQTFRSCCVSQNDIWPDWLWPPYDTQVAASFHSSYLSSSEDIPVAWFCLENLELFGHKHTYLFKIRTQTLQLTDMTDIPISYTQCQMKLHNPTGNSPCTTWMQPPKVGPFLSWALKNPLILCSNLLRVFCLFQLMWKLMKFIILIAGCWWLVFFNVEVCMATPGKE